MHFLPSLWYHSSPCSLPPFPLCRLLTWVLGIYRRIYTATECVCTLSGGACHSQIWPERLEDTLSGVSIAILWLVVIFLSMMAYLPSVTFVQYFEGVAWYIDSTASLTGIGILFALIHIVFTNVAPLIVSFAVPLYCLLYIRKHSITGHTGYKKAVSQLALLVTGNAMNLTANLFIAILNFTSNASMSVYLLYGVGVFSLLPTPIYIITFLRWSGFRWKQSSPVTAVILVK